MNRRDAIKVAGITALVTAVGAEAGGNEPFMNRMEMKPEDTNNMTKGEKKHSPDITIGEKDSKGYTQININVGQDGIMHPSTPDHWIDFIELHVDGKLVGKNTLEAEISRGYTSFSVKLDNAKVLTARSGCNLHGIWTTTKSL
ncbi:class II SORL domain-containing protein [Sulfurimonas sp.]|nr:class II SORL domain-containing protein [Sulfurimonas sp.]